MRLVGSDRGLKEVQVNDGKVIPRQKDGTFHVDGSTGRALAKSGDFAIAGTNFQQARGYVCKCGCRFVSLYRNSCSKCECTELTPEED
jgi:hypothetical protein